MLRLLREASHNADHHIGIAVFGGTIPLLVRIMLFPCYLPNLYPCIFANPIPTPLIGYLPTFIPYNLICLFKNNNGFSIETPLLYPGYIEGNDLGNAWEVPTLFGLEVGLSHQRAAIHCGPHYGKLPSINATYARHKPTIMSGSVPQKSDVALQACPP